MSNDRHERHCSCANVSYNCMQILKWIPVLFITSIIFWSYYAYVVELCICKLTLSTLNFQFIEKTLPNLYFFLDAVPNIAERCVYLLFYHIIAMLFFWSYLQTIFTAPGKVPATVGCLSTFCNEMQIQFEVIIRYLYLFSGEFQSGTSSVCFAPRILNNRKLF